MAYQVLSRKWRPKKFQDVVGQEHVTRSLQNAILKHRLGHAYILTGTRGIGKTSVARIFAKALRCQNISEDGNPCTQCEGCQEVETGNSLNVIEIDGASNNSVDDIRDLINKVQTLPTFGESKVYIIDEVHMLSTSAFNALLKTLEEPPEHVIFILATTEPGKLLSTVLSRCQRFDLRNASLEKLQELIKKIAEEENIYFENEELLQTICRQGKGSFRDTLSLLDQVLSFSSDDKITEAVTSMALGLAKTSSVKQIVYAILKGDIALFSKYYRGILIENVSVSNLSTAILDQFYEVINGMDNKQSAHAQVLSEHDISAQELFWIFETLVSDFEWALNSPASEKVVEIVLQKVCRRRSFFHKSDAEKKTFNTAISPEQPENEEVIKEEVIVEAPKVSELSKLSKILEETEIESETKTEIEIAAEASKTFETKEEPLNIGPKDWTGFLAYLKEKSPATESQIEHGNIINQIDFDRAPIVIELAFSEESKVFYDYCSEIDNKNKLLRFVSEYAQVEEKEVILNFNLIESQEKGDFQSVVEIEKEKEDIERDEKKEEFLTNPLILKAEEIFNSKIDKVKIT
jgi:DNA polymerase III subunit gamma/tau